MKFLNVPSEKVKKCCFISETQILMVVSTFSDFISMNHFLARGFIYKSGVVFQLRGLYFYLLKFGGEGGEMGVG